MDACLIASGQRAEHYEMAAYGRLVAWAKVMDHADVLIWQNAADQLNASFTGNNPNYSFSGAMYFPNADVSFRNGLSASNDCTVFVTRTLSIDHGSGNFSNACSAYGGSPILTIAMAE